MLNIIKRATYTVLLLIGLSFSRDCFDENQQPKLTSRTKFENCQSYYTDKYFVSTLSTELDDALQTLSESISVQVLTDTEDEYIHENFNSSDRKDDDKFEVYEKYQKSVKIVAFHTLEDYIKREFKDDGTSYLVLFIDKAKYLEKIISQNNDLLDLADKSFKNFRYGKDNDQRFNELFYSYFYIKSISGYKIHENTDFKEEYYKLFTQIDSTKTKYLNNIKIEPNDRKYEASRYIENEEKIYVNIDVSNDFPLPNKVFMEMTNLESVDGSNITPYYHKSYRVKDGQISFIPPVIQSSTSNQYIFYYIDLPNPPYPGNEFMEYKIDQERIKLLKELSIEAKYNNEKSEKTKIEVQNDLLLSFNKDKIEGKFNYYKIEPAPRLPSNKINFTEFIEKEIIKANSNKNIKLVDEKEKGQNIRFNINFRKNDNGTGTIIINPPKNGKALKLKWIRKSNSNYIHQDEWEKHKDKFASIIKEYVNEKIEEIDNTIINCNICQGDYIEYYTNNNKNGIKLNSNSKNNYFSFEKGKLNKIEFYKDGYDDKPYLILEDSDIPSKYLFGQEVELTDIVKEYLMKNKMFYNNRGLVSGDVCFKQKNVKYIVELDKGLDIYDFNISTSGLFNYHIDSNKNIISFSKSNLENAQFDLEKSFYKINKRIGSNQLKSSELPTLINIESSYTKKIIVTQEPVSRKSIHYIFPGTANFNLLKSDQGNVFKGVFKLFSLFLLSAYAYDQYNAYNDYEMIYLDKKTQYENLVDGNSEDYTLLRQEAEENYDMMKDHQDNLNFSLLSLGSLYTLNLISIEYKFKNRN